jgi:glycosyltransferase involved in cell wall biosynthesis
MLAADAPSEELPKPRVLVVGPLPPPVGGVETVTQALLESSLVTEFEVVHCDLTKSRPKSTQGKFDLGNLRWALIHFHRMRRSLREFRPDVVYMPVTCTWSAFLRNAYLAKQAKRAGAKLVGHVHGGWFDLLIEREGWRGAIVRRSLNLFDALLVLGEKWRKSIEGYGYHGKVLVVPSTLRNDVLLAADRAPRDYARTPSHAVYVGHIGKNKGVLDLLGAQAKLLSAGTRIPIHYVGPEQFDGEMGRALRLSAALGLDDELARFVGEKRGQELYDEYSTADFMALPSHFEGLPVVFFEAGAFGLPVIGTPVGAVPEFLRDQENSLLVSVSGVDELASALERLWTDADLRQQLGRQLRSDARVFYPDRVCAKIAAAIRSVLEGPA